MALPLYLALTAAEFTACSSLPRFPAWMACHFSPYGTGLSNLPPRLPVGSLLILNDRTPPHGHDPQKIAQQLQCVVKEMACAGVLLDFQRPQDEETAAIAAAVVAGLSCPAAVSDVYAQEMNCPVFLPPPPPHIPLSEHLAPWRGREVWLEAALTQETITVTAQGSHFREDVPTFIEAPHWDEALHCHYQITASPEEITFTLYRASQDLDALLAEAATQGVTTAVGLYQQLARYSSC